MTNNYLQSFSDYTPKYLKKTFAQVGTRKFQMPFRPLDPEELEKIKQKACTVWTEDHENQLKSVTTYSAEYRKKQLDEPTQNLVRPHSPTRLNRPHPPEIFLVTQLDKIPRPYHASESIPILPSRDKWEEVLRQSPGCYKSNRPQGESVNINRTRESLQTLLNNSKAVMIAETRMKLANEKDRQTVKRMMDCAISASVDITRKDAPRQSYIDQTLSKFVKPQCITSIKHWLQKAKQEAP
ncbi:uncharacterized protein [Narcine bancroftii]|uniref:uncharacterized protein isoform X2 n=1 Tax=Narcine bancroftii TaxID=1343680 RepID=UPI0038314C59